MNINKRFLPIKAHYFLFLGCVSPILPFMIVVARQLGIPVIIQGTIGSVILIVTVIIKPFVAAASDVFPKARKFIFILILSIMVCSYFTIVFLPPMHQTEKISISGKIFLPDGEILFDQRKSNISDKEERPLFLLTKDPISDSCHPQELWDCKSECNDSLPFLSSHILLDKTKKDFRFDFNMSEDDLNYRLYIFENSRIGSPICGSEQEFVCEGALYTGYRCKSLWTNYMFYLYLLLLTFGFVTFAIGNSITDAICIDLIGVNGDYGNQRAWGTVGWGLVGPISGLFIDLYSGDRYGKNYLPAFLILFVLGSIDILLSAAKLKVPRMEKNDNLWQSVGGLMKKPQFFAFLCFVIIAGSFDGVVASYIFVLQEEMASNTSYMRYIKFIQGLTIGVQCSLEAPFMWVCGWFIKKLGSSGVMSLVFFLYIIRLFGLGLAGSYGPVWMTLVTEILNGPTYGLGYTAIVIQAGVVTPPGTSATVQSITNICYESLGYSLASLLGGILFTVVGGPIMYYIFGCMAVITFILHLIFMKWETKMNASAEAQSLHESPSCQKEILTPDEKNDDGEVYEAKRLVLEVEQERLQVENPSSEANEKFKESFEIIDDAGKELQPLRDREEL